MTLQERLAMIKAGKEGAGEGVKVVARVNTLEISGECIKADVQESPLARRIRLRKEKEIAAEPATATPSSVTSVASASSATNITNITSASSSTPMQKLMEKEGEGILEKVGAARVARLRTLIPFEPLGESPNILSIEQEAIAKALSDIDAQGGASNYEAYLAHECDFESEANVDYLKLCLAHECSLKTPLEPLDSEVSQLRASNRTLKDQLAVYKEIEIAIETLTERMANYDKRR